MISYLRAARLMLYCSSVLAGLTGLVIGGSPVLKHVLQRIIGRGHSFYPDDLFRSSVIFFLSLILLILVHLGHRLAGAFDVNPDPTTKTVKKPETRLTGG